MHPKKIIEAELLIYSGKRNPKWELSNVLFTIFLKMVDNAPIQKGDFTNKSKLGYSGVLLNTDKLKWYIYNGTIVCKFDSIDVIKKDLDNKIEKWLLNSAPLEIKELVKL